MTYDELINGDDAYAKQIERAYQETHGRPPAITDIAHNIWRLLKEGWTIDAVIRDIRGVTPEPEPNPSFPVPPSGIDLTSWSRRHGCSHAAGLLDSRWDYKAFAPLMAGIFGGKWQTRVNVLSASWAESSPHFVWPFTKLPDGRFDLYRWNPAFFEDRLPRFIEWHNKYGGVPVLTFLELYSWSKRKNVSADHDQDKDWPRNNVNGLHWERDDTTLYRLPDAWLSELIWRVVTVAKNAGIVAVECANEFPEKPVHFKIAEIVKSINPDCRVQVNRNEDTPGQYMNMQVGQGLVDAIAFHGWKDRGFLTDDFPNEPAKRPRTFKQFFDNKAQDGRSLGVDYSRVVCSSDGSRASNDPIHTYDYLELLNVFKFVDSKGGSVEHQSRSKMTPGARVDMVETDFLRQLT